MNGLSIVIPAFNEAQGIGHVLDGLTAIRQHLSCSLELIVVDDGSTDRTAEIARSKQAVVLRHPTNLGYGASVQRGILHATHDWVAIIDADGTYDVQDLTTLLGQVNGYDMVIGARQGPVYRGSLLKYPMRIVFHWLCAYVTGTRVPDVNSGFRLIRKALVLKHAPVLSRGYSFTTSLTMLLLLEGHLVGSVPIRYVRRLGQSKVRLVRDTLRSSQILLEITLLYNPLKVFLVLGLIPLVIGCAFLWKTPWVCSLMIGITCVIWALGGLAVLLSRRNGR